MASVIPNFLFDFGSPNAYLAHKVIPKIEQRTGAKFAYTPVLLGGVFKATGNRSPMEAFAAIPSKLAYEGLETRRFVARHGLAAFRSNPHKMDDPAVILETLAAADLPASRLIELTADQAVKNRLIANTTSAVERGVFGSPTFFVGQEMFFGKDRLEQVEEAIVKNG